MHTVCTCVFVKMQGCKAVQDKQTHVELQSVIRRLKCQAVRQDSVLHTHTKAFLNYLN